MHNEDNTFGPDYDEGIDGERIKTQMETIRDYMLKSKWETLVEIQSSLGYPEASISAQLRHLRKNQFGGFVMEKRRREANKGTYEYRVLAPPEPIEIGDQASIF